MLQILIGVIIVGLVALAGVLCLVCSGHRHDCEYNDFDC